MAHLGWPIEERSARPPPLGIATDIIFRNREGFAGLVQSARTLSGSGKPCKELIDREFQAGDGDRDDPDHDQYQADKG
jgi:hypothetical protein